MALASLGYQFQVNEVPFVLDATTRLNIKKRRERIAFRTLSNQDNVNIAYATGLDTDSVNNLFVSDRSTSLTQNRIPSVSDINTVETKTLYLNVDKFLVTDIFTTATPTQPSTPLFYVHTLANYNPTVDNFANKTLLSIEFADVNLRPIKISGYLLDSTEGLLYNNIDNSYDAGRALASVTFVKYTVRSLESGLQRINIHRELISNEPVYQIATFDDIDSGGNLYVDRKRYILNELPNQQFEVILPTVQTYAYKETPESRIKMLPPISVSVNSPWYVRLTNGKFTTSLQVGINQFDNFKYRIAEFDAQSFQPFPPYKFQSEERATRITNGLIKVAKNIVRNAGLGFFVEVFVYNNLEEIKYVYTTDLGRVPNFYSGTSVRYSDGILSVDEANGFIEVTGPILEDDYVFVNYYLSENEYEFSSIDLNPTNNLDILNQRIVVYVSPETNTTGELDRSLYYLVVNPLGHIVYSSQAYENSAGLDPATLQLLGEDFAVDGSPTHTFYYDRESTERGLLSRVGGFNDEYRDEFSFIDKYTVESVLLTGTTAIPSGTALAENFEDNKRFLVIGDMYVGESQGPDGFTLFDIRKQGGGIKEDLLSDALDEQPEISWYWDLNSNRPYPSVGSFLAEVPNSLLSEQGGLFTHEQISDIVRRHMKFGGYAVVRTYGVNPTVTDYVVDSGQLWFYWPSYGDDVNYNTYLANSLDGPYSRQNEASIVDVASGNYFTIDDLSASTTYYVYVEAVKGEITSSGPVVALTTTAIGG